MSLTVAIALISVATMYLIYSVLSCIELDKRVRTLERDMSYMWADEALKNCPLPDVEKEGDE